MDRNEAVLRELNLYPQWVLREGNREAVGHPAASSLRGRRDAPAEMQAEPVPVEVSVPVVEAAPMPRQQEVAAEPVYAETAVEPLREEAAPAEAGERDRERLIARLGWPELKTMVRDCTACKLRAGCTQTVFGVGDQQADWLFVGEGPGADEDAKGEPFVGQAGKLLDSMLLALKLKRGANVYIANVVKCRPPGNRVPEADEIATCLPYLQRQIQLIQPKVIVALGKTAATALLRMGDAGGIGHPSASSSRGLQTGDVALGSLRGRAHDFGGIPLIVTYHPAYLLRSPQEKAKAWQDLCLARRTMAG